MITDPQYLSVSGLLKARPAEEGGERVLYMEASNETTDLQGERVLAKSLAESAEHFLRYGNLDLDHRTLIAPRGPGDNPYLWEIGRPVDARIDGSATFVKAVLYQGDGPMAENANMVWDSLTRINPPARWYPSVGGQILGRSREIDPMTKAIVNLITRVRWTNIGLSRTPVNPAVPPVAMVPAEVFAKCCTPGGFDLDLAKALEAGYGTDVAGLVDGAALRTQSLDRQPQATLPVQLKPAQIRDILAKRMHPQTLAEHLIEAHGVPEDDALAHARGFLRDLFQNRSTGDADVRLPSPARRTA